MQQDAIWSVLSKFVMAIMLGMRLMKRLKIRRSHNWPTESGRVETTDLRLESRGGTQSVFVAAVKYSYTFEGSTYFGWLRRNYMLRGSAEKWLANFADGRPLHIRRNPKDPSDSILNEHEQASETVSVMRAKVG
jgi:hypothetical protein